MAAKVKQLGANIGLALDGDGDRLIVCDEHGNIVDGDHIMAICAADLMHRRKLKKKTVVATVMSNMGLEQAVTAMGGIDVLFCCAGVLVSGTVMDTTLADWDRTLAVNLTGPFLLCREFGRHMLAAGEGAIVNIASIAGLQGIPDRAAYNASKHGLIGLTRTLAAEWGGRGVRVNAVCPGWVKTEMDDASQAEGAYVDADITDHVPMGRFAAPEDIAQAVAFLADPTRSGYVNGVTLSVDGGWFADGSWQSLRLAARDR